VALRTRLAAGVPFRRCVSLDIHGIGRRRRNLSASHRGSIWGGGYGAASMRVIVARCADAGGYKPLNC
jgi:hypothetical protein